MAPAAQTLVERLGHSPETRLVILKCDDLGECHAANEGIYDALRNGAATSASLMVPAPWAREAAARYRGDDIGVHLTLSADYEFYRWGPITHAPSLLGGDGGFPMTIGDVWEHADLDEVRRECRAQIERAIVWGFDVTHLDSHLGAMQLRPEFFDVYIDMACEFKLPVRMVNAEHEHRVGFPFRKLAAEDGILFPDNFVYVRGLDSDALEETIRTLPPGVTELHLRPATDTPELKSLDPNWRPRVADLKLLNSSHQLVRMLEDAGIGLTGFRALRDIQRA
jgi:predicted glycoside hydrolase/deacetylase ChbG (UPF0249 family)